MVSVSASVDLPLHHKVQKFPSGTGSPWWSWKKAIKRLWWCGMFTTTKIRNGTVHLCVVNFLQCFNALDWMP